MAGFPKQVEANSPAPDAQALPQNVEAEAALLGALMIDNRLADDIQLKLRPEHFFEPLHGRIYQQILRLLDKNMIASPVTLRPLFEADEEMNVLGGPAYLAQLTGSGAAIIGARDFADQVYNLALLRALIDVAREAVERALDTSEEAGPKDQIEDAVSALYRVAEEGRGARIRKRVPKRSSAFSYVEEFMDQRGIVDVGYVADTFRMSKRQLAETAGLGHATLSKAERCTAPKTQARVSEILEIIARVRGWTGGDVQAMAWYRSQPIPALDGRTAEAVVKSGEAGAVRDYLDHLALGGYA